MAKGKCKYCGKDIHPTCIRCDKCDLIWQEAYRDGQKEHQRKLGEVIRALAVVKG